MFENNILFALKWNKETSMGCFFRQMKKDSIILELSGKDDMTVHIGDRDEKNFEMLATLPRRCCVGILTIT